MDRKSRATAPGTADGADKGQTPSLRRAAFTSGRLEQLTEEGQLSRDNLLAAAATAFMQKGLAATSIDDVARRLGATKGLVYHHFRSKNDLFFDVCRRGMEIGRAAITPHVASRERAVTRLARMALAHVRAVMERPEFQLAILEGISVHPGGWSTDEERETMAALIAERERFEALFRDTMAEAIAQGDLESGHAPSLNGHFVLAVLNGPLFWHARRDSETADDRATIARALSIFALRGAGASAAIIEEEFG